ELKNSIDRIAQIPPRDGTEVVQQAPPVVQPAVPESPPQVVYPVEDAPPLYDPASAASAAIEPLRTLKDLEREAIEQALDRVGGNRRKAADILGISARTLYRKLKEFGLE
ncbi:MAG: helix-turn-helix domain-containing protein, partial [Candidatus Latescibacterota bacterium]|nr:helix-turn-helix domain-containing protein [Candidatus Latescibacterota bacterium]